LRPLTKVGGEKQVRDCSCERPPGVFLTSKQYSSKLREDPRDAQRAFIAEQ
jgi:hypothetical protein